MKLQLTPRAFRIEFTAAELEEIRDLIDNKLTAFDQVDREDRMVANRLRAALKKIDALGALRARRTLARSDSRE
jgi:hypothetical protein